MNSSPIHRFRALKQQGSQQFAPEPQEPGKSRGFGWLNFDRDVDTLRAEGADAAALKKSQSSNHRERAQHRDAAFTQMSKQAHELERTTIDQKHEMRAQRFLREHECTEVFGFGSAVETKTYYFDDMLTRLKQKVKNKELLEIVEPELLTSFGRAISKIRTITFGAKYQINDHDAEEVL